jgi:large subunit ribosomal protein L18
MEKTQYKNHMREMRHKRLRAKIVGSATRPRLAVFRSNSFIYAQLIDDAAGKTIAAVDSRKEKTGTGVEKAKAVGVAIATKAKAVNITEVVFDRGGNRYQGSIAALADAAREAGLKF